MLRRILLILSIVGLVGSTLLWGLSFFSLHIPPTKNCSVSLVYGSIDMSYVYSGPGYFQGFDTRWFSDGFMFDQDWIPYFRAYLGDFVGFTLILPMWVPTLIFLSTTSVCVISRRRIDRRARLGLCPRCGYDLRGSPAACPECGHERG